MIPTSRSLETIIDSAHSPWSRRIGAKRPLYPEVSFLFDVVWGYGSTGYILQEFQIGYDRTIK